ncbi:MAG: hypothetical protein GX878_01480, partial [Firmicutes bacterium]|nr:hypothetical protein [Bacillota bacterium]
LIGDIKGSRGIENRDEFQKRLKKVLLEINNKYTEDIASNFTITLGDEFQGLLNKGKNIMSIIAELERKACPVEMRFGIGVGEITTAIDPKWAIGADGPAYHRARKAVQYLKQKEKKKGTGGADIRLEIDGDKQTAVELINTILSLMTVVKRSWTDRQREAAWDLLEHRDSQSAVADRLGITQSSVQKNLAKAHYYAYKEAMAKVEQALGEIRRKDV